MIKKNKLIILFLLCFTTVLPASPAAAKKEIARRQTLVKLRKKGKLDKEAFYVQLYQPVLVGSIGCLKENKRTISKLINSSKKTKSSKRKKAYLIGIKNYKEHSTVLTEIVSKIRAKQYVQLFDLYEKLYSVETIIFRATGSRPKREWLLERELMPKVTSKKGKKDSESDEKKSKDREADKADTKDKK